MKYEITCQKNLISQILFLIAFKNMEIRFYILDLGFKKLANLIF
jgi:hypothetical protein